MLGIRKFKGVAIDLFQGDITTFFCDAIVNAANEQLSGGSGVDGAIHRVGGPSIMEECRSIGSCRTGQAVVTGAGSLPAKKVIHAVGPVFKDGMSGEPELLRSAYLASLRHCAHLELRHIAFPALSAGAYGYLVADAASIAMHTVRDFIEDKSQNDQPGRITFVLFSADIHRVFQAALFACFPEPELP